MNIPCRVIEDLLPMYHDKVCSEESTALVEEHVKSCPQCSRMLSDLSTELFVSEESVDDIQPLKKIQKEYRKLRMGWLVAVLAILVLIPMVLLLGNREKETAPEFTQEEALAVGEAFMTALTDGDYATAFSYCDVDAKRREWMESHGYTEAELTNLEADGLNKFCQQGEKLEDLGGIDACKLIMISELGYDGQGNEEYSLYYTVRFDGKDESFSFSITENGIWSMGAADGLLSHPLQLITIWGEWLWQDYNNCYWDLDAKTYVYYDQEP